MQLYHPNFIQESMQFLVDANYSSQESEEILTLEDLVELLEKLDNYLATI
ncbi:hypothetical protein H6G54_22775 [Anabaena cylindrica FACHB-243]|uniref:Uncharacterized protein n=1 Tax=Anabaena cylindrica (strain ATCC 27899 / PCC 7122) TaxID=272123 RepID=K9ZNT3_ANACC|nr:MULTISPECIES: hypothetical protein [Anabaena]AFZ60903.1 hypothetical protein Anacy_5595 [Anabaena cylindrica PCC 7122]MBD2420477.1 hypothetical protein [Anabaena cylindrica FACHB-243]MBY5282405.1 hypothetical protein [Anabaena sp. CCAP 1446/1C]MBY5306331.1 hypothetical protein [Anabaena sp. CCAP 1446/1C]MCM2406897.1 hypothetical protein [Anabaena sp. CCAP 1446/1C]